MSIPEASTPSASAVLPLTTICGSVDRVGRNRVLEVEVRFAPGEARFEQPHVGLDDLLVLLAEGERDLLARELQVEAVDAAQHPEHEHVLAVARIGDQRAALALERDLVDAEAACVQRCRPSRRRTRRSSGRVLAPHALEQDRGARLELAGAHAAEQHLLVERDDEVGLVAAVGHPLGADADADARGAGDAARRRLDLGRDDLDGPDAVAAARRDRAERLAAALRALARVADDLDDVLGRGSARAWRLPWLRAGRSASAASVMAFSWRLLRDAHAREAVLASSGCRSAWRAAGS